MDEKLMNAYKLVYEDIINSGCGLMVGKYDARHGKNEFMYGIATAMEFIAYKISDEIGDEFSSMFVKNMLDSEKDM